MLHPEELQMCVKDRVFDKKVRDNFWGRILMFAVHTAKMGFLPIMFEAISGDVF